MSEAAALMDRIYRHQRHIYDASRKFYLLGRDEAITKLSPPIGGNALEIGCGTRPGSRRSSAAVRKIARAPGFAVRVISLQSAVRSASFIQS